MSTSSDNSSRLDPLHPNDLTSEQRRVYTAITGGPRAEQPFRTTDGDGRLLGPFDPLLRVPAIGEVVQQLGEKLRFSGLLEPRTRELTILVVAARWGSDYEWYAHSSNARHLGLLTDAELDALRAETVPDSCTRPETAALQLVEHLLRTRHVPAEVYERARQELGEDEVVELTCLVGYYWLLAAVLATFDIPAPEGR